MVVGTSPVGDDGPFKPPLIAQDVPEQVGILVGIAAVDLVVAGHDRLGSRLAHHSLEGG